MANSPQNGIEEAALVRARKELYSVWPLVKDREV
jgi:hypothetical protein